MVAVNKFRGGARVNMFNVTWPFATMEITKEYIEIKFFSKEYKFYVDEISVIEKYKGLVSKGLRIIRKNNGCPESFIFWTFQQKRILSCLSGSGYNGVLKENTHCSRRCYKDFGNNG